MPSDSSEYVGCDVEGCEDESVEYEVDDVLDSVSEWLFGLTCVEYLVLFVESECCVVFEFGEDGVVYPDGVFVFFDVLFFVFEDSFFELGVVVE